MVFSIGASAIGVVDRVFNGWGRVAVDVFDGLVGNKRYGFDCLIDDRVGLVVVVLLIGIGVFARGERACAERKDGIAVELGLAMRC